MAGGFRDLSWTPVPPIRCRNRDVSSSESAAAGGNQGPKSRTWGDVRAVPRHGEVVRLRLGVQAGRLWWGTAAGLGLIAVLAASHALYTGLRWAGAGYLRYLGVRLLTERHAGAERPEPPGRNRFARGVLTNALNPKVGAFSLSLLPQFVPAGAPVLPWSLLLTGVHVAEGVAWCGVLVLLADRLGRRLRRPGVRRMLDRVAGTAFADFAVRLAMRP